MLKVIDSKISWDKELDDIFHDVYHTYDYHNISCRSKDYPVLLKYQNLKTTILFPLIIRKIDNTNYSDITSSYGYPGPLCSSKKVTKEEALDFSSQLKAFFKDFNIISVFSRLNPIIDNSDVLSQIGSIESLNQTVVIDLNLGLEQQRSQYRKSNKSEINQLRRKGYEVHKANSDEEIDLFVQIYNENMDRLGASKEYYFNRDYFLRLLESKSFQTEILIAKNGNVVTSGAIFMICDKIMNYHLSGTSKKYLNDHPMKLIIDDARLLGNNLNLSALHLGGGNDSLFLFKSGFSESRLTFKIWKHIVDKKIYNQLSKNSKNKNKGFFPEYRS